MKLFIVGALTVFSLLVALTLAENYGFGGGFGGGAGGYGGGYGSGYTFIPLPGYGGSLGGLGGLDDSWILGFIGLMFILTMLFSNASQENSTARIITIK